MRLSERIGAVPPGRAGRLLTLNALPHPRWLGALPNALTLVSKGGTVWIAGALGARLLGVPGSGWVVGELLPSVLGATLVMQYPLKWLVRQPRPLSVRARALAVGEASRSSFPSGDAAPALAGAWVPSAAWPRGAPAFLGLAAALGAPRMDVGTHRPSDVAAVALAGLALAEPLRRAARWVLAAARRPGDPTGAPGEDGRGRGAGPAVSPRDGRKEARP